MSKKDNISLKNTSDDIIKLNFVDEVKSIINNGLECISKTAHTVILSTYWQIGRKIVEEEQNGNTRADYGKSLIQALSDALRSEYGNSYSARYLRAFRQFFLLIPDFEIWKSRFPNLTWTHVYRAMRVGNETAIRWYLQTASEQSWSVRTLDRNISTQYFERHLSSPSTIESNIQHKPSSILKNPVLAEFLGFQQTLDVNESDIETAILSHLQQFIMEMGRGFAFVGRQQLIRTESQDYFIDLVFYNIELKCYVLIDLKMGKISHKDVGQMDMYVRMYDDLKLTAGDNPTIGIVLCSETDKDIARYSVLHDNNRLFASKYMLYLPTPEALAREIEKQKEFYLLQHSQSPKESK